MNIHEENELIAKVSILKCEKKELLKRNVLLQKENEKLRKELEKYING